MYLGETYVGSIGKELSFFKPKYNIDCNGWHIEGDIFGWDYSVIAPGGALVATVSKELFKFTDTYVLDIKNPSDILCVLMFALAIDAEKCSNN